MPMDQERFVPKVHPATRAVEPDDPMSLTATAVAGDADLMFRSVVQEYAWMGWNADQIIDLFKDPFYPVLNSLWCALGESVVSERVRSVLRRTGVLHFKTTLEEAPETANFGPEVIQIGMPARPSPSVAPARVSSAASPSPRVS
jgi:hypothetical protein